MFGRSPFLNSTLDSTIKVSVPRTNEAHPIFLLFIICTPRGCLCKRGGNQASHAFFDVCKINLHISIFCSTFAFGNRKPRRAVCTFFYPPRVVYLIRLIVMRISNKRKTNTKIAFFIVFSVSLFLLCTIRRGASARTPSRVRFSFI